MEREIHERNLKIIASQTKNKKNTQAKKINLGKNLMKSIQGMGCKPEKVFYASGNEVVVSKDKSPFFAVEKSSDITRGMKKIGKGQWGQVYMGCIDKECKKPIAIKIVKNASIEHEYKMGKRMALFGGVKPFTLEKCNNMSFLYTQYANNGTLRDFIKTNKHKLLPIHFRTIITQILHSLYRAQMKYPTFRHHDLHTENILINTSSPSRVRIIKASNMQFKVHDIGLQTMMSDFGLSTLKNYKCPPIDEDPSWYKKEVGIYRGSHNMYDVQYFLSGIRTDIKINGIRNGSEAVQFIERILPSEYLQKESSKVHDWRLRASPLGHPDLPSFKKIFNDRYFSPYKKTPIPLDISTFIKRTPSKPKNIIVKHGGGKVKKTLDQIKKELASKNNKKVLKRPALKVRIQPKATPKPKISMSNKGYIRVGSRKCTSYKKQELINLAKRMNINTDKKTIEKICQEIKLKYIK